MCGWSHDPPHTIELAAGRRVSDHLISTVEHRVIQSCTGPTTSWPHASRTRWSAGTLAVTMGLLEQAACTQDEAGASSPPSAS
jgi:hypothetical protein